MLRSAAQRTGAQFDRVHAALDEQRQRFFPDVARALGVSTDALLADVTQQFPDAAKGLREIDGILTRIDADVRFREQNVDEFATVKDLPMRAAAWLFLAASAAVLAIAGVTLLRGVDSASYRMSID